MSKQLASFWISHLSVCQKVCPELENFTCSFKTDTVKNSAGISKLADLILLKQSEPNFKMHRTVKLNLTIQTKLIVQFCTLAACNSNNAVRCCMMIKVRTCMQDVMYKLKCLVQDCFGEVQTLSKSGQMTP